MVAATVKTQILRVGYMSPAPGGDQLGFNLTSSDGSHDRGPSPRRARRVEATAAGLGERWASDCPGYLRPPLRCALRSRVGRDSALSCHIMIIDYFSDLFIRFWELLTCWRYPPPALPRMRLQPERSDDNALMVSSTCVAW